MVKNLAANAGDAGSIHGPGRFPGEGNGNPLQYSCLENPTARRAWQAAVHGVAKRIRQNLATKQQQTKLTPNRTSKRRANKTPHWQKARHYKDQSRNKTDTKKTI